MKRDDVAIGERGILRLLDIILKAYFNLFSPNWSVAKTFASGKTEKLIYQCMKEIGLPHDKVSGIYSQKAPLSILIFYL